MSVALPVGMAAMVSRVRRVPPGFVARWGQLVPLVLPVPLVLRVPMVHRELRVPMAEALLQARFC